MDITHIDHLVLTVKNIDESIKFYESVPGMVVETFNDDWNAMNGQ